jgi:transposase
VNETDDEARPAARAVPDRALLTDAQWARLAPLLPPQQPKTGSRGGRPNKDHRLVVEGMLWILRTGAPWRDLPKDYGPHSTVANRFYRWWRAGILERVFAALLADGDARGALDWLLHYLDGTVVRAHQHAAGAPQKGPLSSSIVTAPRASTSDPNWLTCANQATWRTRPIRCSGSIATRSTTQTATIAGWPN